MSTGSFYDLEVWSFIVIIAILCGAVLLANVLKRFIKPLRESLIPNSVLGGIILLIPTVIKSIKLLIRNKKE